MKCIKYGRHGYCLPIYCDLCAWSFHSTCTRQKGTKFHLKQLTHENKYCFVWPIVLILSDLKLIYPTWQKSLVAIQRLFCPVLTAFRFCMMYAAFYETIVSRNHLISTCNSDFDWLKRKGYTSMHQTRSTPIATSIATPLVTLTSNWILDNKNKHSFCKKSVCFYCITTSLWRTPVNHLNFRRFYCVKN